ncbi:MAG TPA: c-type cytochrome [Vitreimonas sp.]|jgi:mono/diheme cytochrome c family protein|nr:c-type cytochrome [Vitreimonas sp.]
MWKFVTAVALAALLGACVQQTSSSKPGTAQLVERGRYLVTGIGGCNDCHTPPTPQGPDMAHSLQGAPLAFELLPAFKGQVPWAEVAPPIAGGPAAYTDEQFAHFLQTGEKPDGSHARPPMPQFRMNEEDARAVVAYIKTVPRAS